MRLNRGASQRVGAPQGPRPPSVRQRGMCGYAVAAHGMRQRLTFVATTTRLLSVSSVNRATYCSATIELGSRGMVSMLWRGLEIQDGETGE